MSSNIKTVKEVFLDYKETDKILNCKIENMNLYKATNTLDVSLISEEEINLEEEYIFKVYLKNKLNIENINIKIQNINKVQANVELGKDAPATEPKKPKKEQPPEIIYGRKSTARIELSKIIDITVDSGRVAIQGEVVNIDSRELRNEKILLLCDVYDKTSTITCKTFIEKEKFPEVIERLKNTKMIRALGNAQYDPYAKEIGIISNLLIDLGEGNVSAQQQRVDNAKTKRVELHMHTQMSQMDGVSSATDLIKRAGSWGMKSIAITDHGVVQAFPEAYAAAKKNGIKVIYGVEAYLVPDKISSVVNSSNQDIDTVYSVLDIETTGLHYRTEKITEFGIIKIKNGEVIDQFECFVNPEMPIPYRITELTGITDSMVKTAETIDKVMPKVLDFIGDSVLVAHNASFDMGFIKYNAEELGFKIENAVIDTLKLSKELFPNFKKYKLGIIADNLGIKVDVAHRALDDVKTLVQIFNIMLNMLKEKGAKTIEDIDNVGADDSVCPKGLQNNTKGQTESSAPTTNIKNLDSYHAIILAKNYTGLKNLYKLISFSHLDYFYKKPRVLKSLYLKHSEGLILGSACEAGEVYKAIVSGKSEEEIENIAKDYDYLEIQPLGNNMYLVNNGTVSSIEELKNINRKIVELGEKLNKPVVATCDVHFLDPQDEIYRRILMAGQGFADADDQAPLYLRTTEEMLDEFAYLESKKCYEVVVENTNKIADMCEEIQPVPDGTFPPNIEGSEEEIERIAWGKAKDIYGRCRGDVSSPAGDQRSPLQDNIVIPQIVTDRLKKELDSIIKNGFAVMYIIAQKLVWKSNEDGYLVGSRGSVGSSFVANMTGITEVNALPPHYVCQKCKYSDFTNYGYKNGFDLPDKECPECGAELKKDGMDIPFETFLGFDGDKAPDIDLNFSGEYQSKAHKYTEVLFGKGKTFKAGTIGTIADKTAFGFVKKYYEAKEIPINNAEINRIIKGCTGVKRTTGQHPGGIIVVPGDKEIYDFCPVQHPADAVNSDIITTHFDFHSIHDNLLKLDILGHDDPTVIRMLQDITGIDPKTIPLDDKETMSLFTSTKALKINPQQINSEVGTFGVPEFGTKFVRQMLLDTKPTKFEELILISGLSHGTDVWINNAQDLIKSGTTTLSDAICTRDDIMLYLIRKELPPKVAFNIMENVRKGKGLTEEMEGCMLEYNVPEWYIESCKKIKYMFPKAHAAAYVTMAFKIAWFKVHYPEAFYTAYFSVRADEFDSECMIYGREKVRAKMKELEAQGNAITTKDKNMYSILELVLEMYERGIKFLPIDLYKSDAKKFILEEEGIRPPFASIAGLGEIAAKGIYEAKNDGKYMSVEDLRIKAKIGNSVVEMLGKSGCLQGMSLSNQMSLFG